MDFIIVIVVTPSTTRLQHMIRNLLRPVKDQLDVLDHSDALRVVRTLATNKRFRDH